MVWSLGFVKFVWSLVGKSPEISKKKKKKGENLEKLIKPQTLKKFQSNYGNFIRVRKFEKF